MQHRLPLLIVLPFFIAVTTAKLSAENWPEFRGPSANGHAVGDLPLQWSETKNVRWKIDIHDRGWSSPVIWKDQIWLTTATRDGKKMYAVCVNKNTGKIEHDLLLLENKEPRFCHPTNSYASPTPVVEEGRVYVHFGSYGTFAINSATGETLWSRKDLPCDHWRGPGSSLMLYDDKLYVPFDGYDLQYMVAFDKTTGKTVWKKDRNIDYHSDNGDHRKAYCTCIAVEEGGRKQIISPSAYDTISYDPQTGEELWRVKHGGMNAASRPVYADGIVYIVIGDAGPTLYAVKTDGSGDVTDTHVAWSMKAGGPKRPSPILTNGLLFYVTDDGVANCVDAKTGKNHWKKRLAGKFRSSPILANDRVYYFDLDGKSSVVKASREFALLAENHLESGCQASAAVSGDALFVRTVKSLYRIESKNN